MRIQHNIMAMNAYRNYSNNTSALAKNLEKLSSGYRINRAGDDAAGLAISEKMRAQITALGTAQKNVKDGISLVKTAEGATQEIHDMLNRMVDLATQSANGTYQDKVDREAIENEFNALKTEIDRIADSSNFNGIKLLDGKLGLNGDAFSFQSVAAKDASDGTVDLSEALAAKGADYSDVHLETSAVTAAAPKFTVDLGTLALTGATATDTVKVTFAGNEYTVTPGKTGAVTAQDVATALKTAINAGGVPGAIKADGDTAAAGDTVAGIRIGDAAFSIGNPTNGAIEFIYMGRYDAAGTFTSETNFTGTKEEADAINDSLGFAVEVGDVTGTGVKSGHAVHDATKVDQAKAAVTAGLAGIDLTLNSDIVKNNNILEIDGVKYQFKTSATGFTADAAATLIDVSAGKDADEQIHMAADLLSKQTVTATGDGAGRTWAIGVEDGATIHIEQKTTATDTTQVLDTYEKLAGVISAKGTATPAKNAGTEITLTAGSLKKGDALTVLDGSKEKRYSYDKDFTDIASLKKAMEDDGFTVGVDGDKLTVYAKDAESTAPTVLGKGLTLQIGEDSQEYNQLSVAISDMHVSALGLDTHSLGTQESAQKAVSAIKDAINSVSSTRGRLGATQNRLEHTANNLSTMKENIQDAEATIRDTDIAEEMMAYTKNNILVQSAQAMLAQANQIPQGVLQLLG